MTIHEMLEFVLFFLKACWEIVSIIDWLTVVFTWLFILVISGVRIWPIFFSASEHLSARCKLSTHIYILCLRQTWNCSHTNKKENNNFCEIVARTIHCIKYFDFLFIRISSILSLWCCIFNITRHKHCSIEYLTIHKMYVSLFAEANFSD